MNFTRLNKDWNAEPNAPDVRLSVDGTNVRLEFYLNSFMYNNVKQGDKATLTFYNCHKYSLNSMNDEGYYMGQYRYKDSELPWGEFYQLDTDWRGDFPQEQVILNPHTTGKRHYIFFLKDNTFECAADNFSFERLTVSASKQ